MNDLPNSVAVKFGSKPVMIEDRIVTKVFSKTYTAVQQQLIWAVVPYMPSKRFFSFTKNHSFKRFLFSGRFLATVSKTVRRMLSDRCLSCLSVCLSVRPSDYGCREG